MSVSSTISPDGRHVDIQIGGRFDFSEHRAFRAAYGKAELKGARVTVDLSAAEYMDSSALGMLLVLRERAGGDQSDITLKGVRKEIQQVLAVSRFEQLFRIE